MPILGPYGFVDSKIFVQKKKKTLKKITSQSVFVYKANTPTNNNSLECKSQNEVN